MDCSICCEKFNLSNRKKIDCFSCNFQSCRTCFQKYLVEITVDPHCMNCKKEFNNDFISSNCTNIFITKSLNVHREDILLDREKGLLIETQPYVIRAKEIRKLEKEVREIEKQKNEFRRQIALLDNQSGRIYNQINRLTHAGNNIIDEIEEGKVKYIRKCPIKDCRGFLDTHWKCGVCDSKICSKCNEEKLDSHECIPDSVASMELLKKDSKPCPECGEVIFKISGCSQMFCTSCKTPWNWTTGKKESGVIHNPHYYEYLNQGGRNLNGDHRNAGDIPCGGLPDAYEFRQSISFYNKSSELKKYNIAFENLHRNTSHILNYELRQLQVIDPVIKNRDLRVKYILNELTEDQFKHELQLSEKKCQKVIAYRNIYQMFVDVSSDNLRQIVIFNRTRPDFQVAENFFKEQIEIYNGLVTYFNQSLEKVGKMYKCVYPAIMPDTFNLINNISSHNKEIKRRDAQREQARMLGNNV